MKVNKNIVFLIAYVLALCTMAWAGYYYYADYKMQLSEKQPSKSDRFQTDLSYVDLPRISVTLTSDSTNRRGTVRMDITLEVENKYAARVEGYKPRIADRLVHYTQTLDYDDLSRPRSTIWLKPDLLKEINIASAPAPVRDIIFREFLVL